MSHGIFWPHPRRLREQQKQYWSPLATTTVVTVAVAAAKHDGQQHDTEGRELMQAASPNHNVHFRIQAAQKRQPACRNQPWSKLRELPGFGLSWAFGALSFGIQGSSCFSLSPGCRLWPTEREHRHCRARLSEIHGGHQADLNRQPLQAEAEAEQ